MQNEIKMFTHICLLVKCGAQISKADLLGSFTEEEFIILSIGVFLLS